MKPWVNFFIVVLLAITLAACGPSAPNPAQPTAPAKTKATPTAAQVAQAVKSPIAPQVVATSSTGCAIPPGWSPYTVKPGDTLYALAKQVNLTPEELTRANCLTSSLISMGATLYLPLQSCTPTPPEDWLLYTVRNGDTLFSLATTRDTTVSEVKRVNCLVSDSLEVGSQLYLPHLAILPPPALQPIAPPQPAEASVAPPATAQSTACNTGSCLVPPTLVLAPLMATPPAPATRLLPPTLVLAPAMATPPAPPTPSMIVQIIPTPVPPPCGYSPGRPKPWIDTSFSDTGELDLGERGYFYACDFPTSPTTATMTLSDGFTESVELLPLSLDQINGPDSRAQAVFDWPALPTQPTGVYTLTVASSDGSSAFVEFLVGPPTHEAVLPVPQAAPPGTIFRVYYVYFPMNSTPTFQFYRPSDTPSGESLKTIYSIPDQWQIPISQPLANANDKGWGVQTQLATFASDPTGEYAIGDSNADWASIWLLP